MTVVHPVQRCLASLVLALAAASCNQVLGLDPVERRDGATIDGDPTDADPTDADPTDDPDGDNVPSASDNCPTIANALQHDEDTDGDR